MQCTTRQYKHELISINNTQTNLKAHKNYQLSASYSINWPWNTHAMEAFWATICPLYRAQQYT